jgi:hypothetical protein
MPLYITNEDGTISIVPGQKHAAAVGTSSSIVSTTSATVVPRLVPRWAEEADPAGATTTPTGTDAATDAPLTDAGEKKEEKKIRFRDMTPEQQEAFLADKKRKELENSKRSLQGIPIGENLKPREIARQQNRYKGSSHRTNEYNRPGASSSFAARDEKAKQYDDRLVQRHAGKSRGGQPGPVGSNDYEPSFYSSPSSPVRADEEQEQRVVLKPGQTVYTVYPGENRYEIVLNKESYDLVVDTVERIEGAYIFQDEKDRRVRRMCLRISENQAGKMGSADVQQFIIDCFNKLVTGIKIRCFVWNDKVVVAIVDNDTVISAYDPNYFVVATRGEVTGRDAFGLVCDWTRATGNYTEAVFDQDHPVVSGVLKSPPVNRSRRQPTNGRGSGSGSRENGSRYGNR